ncbi:MAG: hypothetical protein HPY60_11520 [Candidatus Methanofastidiosum sp.]|nr:hypothetical protein [Methanofastidiosum sp.]
MKSSFKKIGKDLQLVNKHINTVSQCRLPVFAPTYKPAKNTKKTREEIIQTPWGQLSIQGELTQLHRDILDWIFAKAKQHEKHESVFLFTTRQLAKGLGIYCKNGNYHKFITNKLEEMRKAKVTIKTDKFTVHFGLIRKHGYSEYIKNAEAEKGKKLFKDKVYYVVFEPEYMMLLKTDVAIFYLPLVDEIINIDDPVVKAFVRFVISHQNLKMHLNSIIDVLGLDDISNRNKARKKKEILERKEYLQEKFGIKIDDKQMVSYTQKKPDVFFVVPKLPEGEIIIGL